MDQWVRPYLKATAEDPVQDRELVTLLNSLGPSNGDRETVLALTSGILDERNVRDVADGIEEQVLGII